MPDDLPPIPMVLMVFPPEGGRPELAKSLEAASWRVIQADSASGALTRMRRRVPDAVVCAEGLPDSSGHEFCEVVRRVPEWQALPLLMLGARVDAAALERALEAGADELLPACCDAGELLIRLRWAIRRAESRARGLAFERLQAVRLAASTMAHHLSVPTSFISMCAEHLQDQLQPHQEARPLAQQIEQQVARIRALTARMKAAETAETGLDFEEPELLELPAEEAVSPDGLARSEPYRVLVVDDERDIRAVVRSALHRTKQFHVREAGGGVEALELARRERPDLVLLDLGMPGMSGEEVCAKMRSDPELKRIPVVILTGMCGVQEMVRLFGLGVEGYLVKPFHIADLAQRVLQIIQRMEWLRTLRAPLAR
ncbi:MAG: response regulator [Candidatus Wallbacteria bacterium]|nr:response regulator [Candidatus Wallbacteria bacterium]